MNIYSENRKATFEYEVLEKYEAGLVLTGQEVKSIKGGHINLAGSFVTFREGHTLLVGSKVPPYQPKNAPTDYNPERERRVLLNQKEIEYLSGRAQEKGFSLIPLKVYEKNGRIKLEFGLARGKKKHDKKEKLKERDVKRQIQRELK